MGFLLLGILASQGLRAATCPLHNHGNLAVIIDDLGYNLRTAKVAAAIPAPLTMSIIPGTPYAMEVADLGARRGKEVMLHMPMAAVRTAVSDPLVLDKQLPVADISQRVQEALLSVPGAAGMNNHMGSALTTNRRAMDALMSELAAKVCSSSIPEPPLKQLPEMRQKPRVFPVLHERYFLITTLS